MTTNLTGHKGTRMCSGSNLFPSRGQIAMLFRALAFLAVGLGLAGCTTSGGFGPSSGVVSMKDRVIGLDGGVVSGRVGAGLTAAERSVAVAAEIEALDSAPGSSAVQWGDVAGGRFGEAKAGLPYRVGTQDCRPLTQTVMIGGEPASATGAACRDERGIWVRVA